MRLFAPVCVAGLAVAPIGAFVLETNRNNVPKMALRSTPDDNHNEDTMSRRTMIGNALAFSAISLIPTASQAKVCLLAGRRRHWNYQRRWIYQAK
jgi:hypothetical protein